MNPDDRLHARVADLIELEREGLRLTSKGVVRGIAAWHRQWTALAREIRAQLETAAPRQAASVLWPTVDEFQSPDEVRIELVRAAVGCRELDLLANSYPAIGRTLWRHQRRFPRLQHLIEGRSLSVEVRNSRGP